MRRTAPIVMLAAAVGAAAFLLWPDARSPAPGAAAPVALYRPDPVQGPAINDSTFAALVRELSEAGRYFDTDNLISNESSYLHVIDGIRERGLNGGAYLGVGPDQNFSYMAAIRPRIAFIIDVRRDNVLQHLWFKALFELAPTRIEYLALMFGRAPPADPADWTDRPLDELLDWVDGTPPDPAYRDSMRTIVVARTAATGVQLSEQDLRTIQRIHSTFANAGPSLRYSSHGRAPRPSYPTYRQLLLATDREGSRANYLGREQDYAFLRAMQQANLVIPIVGDFAGPSAIRDVARYLQQNGLQVSAFYLSNVEFYLFQDRIFDRFARNVATLPFYERTVMIRSLFGNIYGHPMSMPGFNSTQLMQDMTGFVSGFNAGQYQTYEDLVYRGYIRY